MKIAIIYSEYVSTIDALKYKFKEHQIDCYTVENNCLELYDLIIDINYGIRVNSNVLSCHHSLLPSFDCEEPEKEAFLYGAKVSGVSFIYKNKIVAQYPIFITSAMHYEDLKQELNYVEQTLFPLVAEKILNNEPFEVQTLIGKTSCCSGGCTGCSH